MGTVDDGISIAQDVARATGSEELGRGAGVAAQAAQGAAIGATIGSLIPGIGTAVGGVAGAIVGGVVEFADWIGDLWGAPPSWHRVEDRYGSRVMPRWWSPSWRWPWETHTAIGDRLFRDRRATEDGCSRSETCFALAALFGDRASREVRARLRVVGRDRFLREAWLLCGNSADACLSEAQRGPVAAMFRAMEAAMPASQRAEHTEARRVIEATALVTAYRRRGLSLEQANWIVEKTWPDRLRLSNRRRGEIRARSAGARRDFLEGVTVPRLPVDGSSVEDCAAAITCMEAWYEGDADWQNAAGRNGLHVAQMTAWLRGDPNWRDVAGPAVQGPAHVARDEHGKARQLGWEVDRDWAYERGAGGKIVAREKVVARRD